MAAGCAAIAVFILGRRIGEGSFPSQPRHGRADERASAGARAGIDRRSRIVVLAGVLGGLSGVFLGLLTSAFSGSADPNAREWSWMHQRFIVELACMGVIVGVGIATWATRRRGGRWKE
jgi:protein-S-isoprenylcysteine O-methyltransferase Ste14